MSTTATDPSQQEHQRQTQELLAEIKAHPDGADLLLTAFYTAATHYRRGTICTPFPTELFTRPTDKEKDFPALHAALASLPPVHALLSDDGLPALPPPCRSLLLWLLLHPTRRRRFSLVHQADVVRQLRQRCGTAWSLPALQGASSPSYVLRAHEGHAQPPFAHSTIAYHGTHLENLHSILHTGLQPLSGTKLQRNGAIFGSGIYLSTSYDTAFSFCEPRAAWARSRFGTKLRVLLVCEVDLDRATRSSASAAAAANGSAAPPPASPSSSSGPALPDTYLLVERGDAVRLLFVALYCDARAGGGGQHVSTRVNWCTVMVVLYAAFLVGKALLAALRQHPY